jgi:hypothetical protein
MTSELHTVAETAQILKVRESWLKTKASARLVPCTFVGKHLRFSDDDIAEIMRVGARQPVTRRRGQRAATPEENASGVRGEARKRAAAVAGEVQAAQWRRDQ